MKEKNLGKKVKGQKLNFKNVKKKISKREKSFFYEGAFSVDKNWGGGPGINVRNALCAPITNAPRARRITVCDFFSDKKKYFFFFHALKNETRNLMERRLSEIVTKIFINLVKIFLY